MSDKPATGEWIPAAIRLGLRPDEIDALNAALAAERERLEATYWKHTDELRKQLAAEQQKSKVLGSIVEGLRAKLPPEETNPLMKQMADSLEQKWNKVKEAK